MKKLLITSVALLAIVGSAWGNESHKESNSYIYLQQSFLYENIGEILDNNNRYSGMIKDGWSERNYYNVSMGGVFLLCDEMLSGNNEFNGSNVTIHTYGQMEATCRISMLYSMIDHVLRLNKGICKNYMKKQKKTNN